MSRNYQTNAINIKSYNLSDNDKIIVMYSKDYGIIRAVAKGVKKPKSKLGGRMDLLVNNSLLLAKGKNLDIVSQAEVLNGFNRIRTDIFKISYASYCAELINIFGIEEDVNCDKIYSLLTQTLSNINDVDSKNEILSHVIHFQTELMKIIGYELALNACASCGKPYEDNFIFSITSGGVVCPNCSQIFYPDSTTEKLVNILSAPFNYDSFDDLNEGFNVMEKYISLHSHKKIKSSEFLAVI